MATGKMRARNSGGAPSSSPARKLNSGGGCCPDGLLCDCARGTCDTASGTNMAMKSFVQMMNEPIKPVDKKV